MPQVHASAACCNCMWRLHLAPARCTCMLRTACVCFNCTMPQLHVATACACCNCMLHLHFVIACCNCMLQLHATIACCHCICMLQLYIHAAIVSSWCIIVNVYICMLYLHAACCDFTRRFHSEEPTSMWYMHIAVVSACCSCMCMLRLLCFQMHGATSFGAPP